MDEASFESVYVKLSTIQMPGSGRSSFSPVAVKDSELEGRVEKHKKTMSCTKVSPTNNADFEQCERLAMGREEPLMEVSGMLAKWHFDEQHLCFHVLICRRHLRANGFIF